MVLGYHCRHHFDRAFVIKALAWSDVQLVRNSIQLLLAIARKVSAFRQILAVGVLIATALPRAMRVAKIDRHSSSLSDVCNILIRSRSR